MFTQMIPTLPENLILDLSEQPYYDAGLNIDIGQGVNNPYRSGTSQMKNGRYQMVPRI